MRAEYREGERFERLSFTGETFYDCDFSDCVFADCTFEDCTKRKPPVKKFSPGTLYQQDLIFRAST